MEITTTSVDSYMRFVKIYMKYVQNHSSGGFNQQFLAP